jgi:hypothetical protein
MCELLKGRLTEPDRGNSTKETSQSVSADCDALDVGSRVLGRGRAGTLDIDLREVFKEAW